MGKNILVLNGSPRAYGNTRKLVESFIAGAEHAGSTTECFDLHWMKIHQCLGCCCGGQDARFPCVQQDDMQSIYRAFHKADAICFASPLYFWTVSAQLKTAIDRLFALAECDPDYRLPHKECVLLMTAEGTEFEESVRWFEQLAEHLGWTSAGNVLCGGISKGADIDGRPELEEAYRLGSAL